MSSSFFETSKTIADEYLQSIVFIDDEVYSEKSTQKHPFSQEEVSKYFLENNKICAIYNPKSEKDLVNLVSISKKADIVVLDWNMDLESSDKETIGAGEEDVDEVDPRGVHTIKMIPKILFNEENEPLGMKIIVVYTGETGLSDQRNIVFDKIKLIDQAVEKEGDYNLIGSSFKIVFISKESTLQKHISPRLKKRIISYKNLPDFVLTEYATLTNGLLSNFALKALSEIRINSNKILSLFSKDLDPAYLSHQSLLPNNEDANELLVELIKDSFGSLLKYRKVNQFIDKQLIKQWIESNINEYSIKLVNGEGVSQTEKFVRNRELLVELLSSAEQDVAKKYESEFNKLTDFKNHSARKKERHLKFIQKNNLSTFLNESQLSKEEELNFRFAKLTHHKNLYTPIGFEPRLTLGTIIKSTRKENYYLCIQQRCDSVRLSGVERKFLFLPLETAEKGIFQLITPNKTKLKLNTETFSIRTIKFTGHETEGVVKGEKQNNGGFLFKQKYSEGDDEQFIWVLDLKDLHAQRIVDQYASQLSRVGLDESEWLRRWSN